MYFFFFVCVLPRFLFFVFGFCRRRVRMTPKKNPPMCLIASGLVFPVLRSDPTVCQGDRLVTRLLVCKREGTRTRRCPHPAPHKHVANVRTSVFQSCSTLLASRFPHFVLVIASTMLLGTRAPIWRESASDSREFDISEISDSLSIFSFSSGIHVAPFHALIRSHFERMTNVDNEDSRNNRLEETQRCNRPYSLRDPSVSSAKKRSSPCASSSKIS